MREHCPNHSGNGGNRLEDDRAVAVAFGEEGVGDEAQQLCEAERETVGKANGRVMDTRRGVALVDERLAIAIEDRIDHYQSFQTAGSLLRSVISLPIGDSSRRKLRVSNFGNGGSGSRSIPLSSGLVKRKSREFQLPIGAFRDHHEHQILKCDHSDAKLDQLGGVQVGDIRTVN